MANEKEVNAKKEKDRVTKLGSPYEGKNGKYVIDVKLSSGREFSLKFPSKYEANVFWNLAYTILRKAS